MNRVDQYMADRLAERAAAGNLRRLLPDQPGIDFRSNDYLGIATGGLLNGFSGEKRKTGSTGSRLIAGNSAFAESLESQIAAFHGTEDAIIFNSGFDANIGLLTAIASRETIFLYDELCHASIIDGIRGSLCRQKFRFAHNNPADLRTLLQKHSLTGPVIVVTEAVFSMDGDKAPLTDLVTLCEEFDARLIVDEAHATGVVGTRGEGLVCALGLQQRVFARVHTFGKALGCHGAAVVGSHLLKQYLVNFARTFIFTTALPEHSLYAIHNAYQYLAAPGFSNQPLHDLITAFRLRIAQAGIVGFCDSDTPVQAMIRGGNEPTKELAARLRQAGLLVNAILYPTVPQGRERLRICLHTFNTTEQLDILINHLRS
jgi:8-amino-7-oxononanoate synthase